MLDLFKVFMPDDLDYSELARILNSGKLTSGNYVSLFEQKLKEFIGNPYILVTSNNNLAALIAYASFGLKPGDEVIASPMACLASNMPILNFGAKVVWADIDPSTGTLIPEDVKSKVSAKTRAILHYHWAGYPGYIDEINRVGREYGLIVIDDAIESFGSKYKLKYLGSLGTDITLFSFQTVRLPHSIDGGALAFSSKELYDKAIRIRDYGIERSTFRDGFGEISKASDILYGGYNAVMSELNAFIGLSVLEKTNDLLSVQKINSGYWDEYCNKNGFQRLNTRKEIEPNYWVYSFLCQDRDRLMVELRDSGYYASKLHIRNDVYSCFNASSNNLDGVNEFEQRQLTVPSGWWEDLETHPRTI